jgi:hypothetical protein
MAQCTRSLTTPQNRPWVNAARQRPREHPRILYSPRLDGLGWRNRLSGQGARPFPSQRLGSGPEPEEAGASPAQKLYTRRCTHEISRYSLCWFHRNSSANWTPIGENRYNLLASVYVLSIAWDCRQSDRRTNRVRDGVPLAFCSRLNGRALYTEELRRGSALRI